MTFRQRILGFSIKTMSHKKMDKLKLNKLKNFDFKKYHEGNGQLSGRNYLQIIYLIKGLYQESKKNFYNSIRRQSTQLKMTQILERTFHQGQPRNG